MTPVGRGGQRSWNREQVRAIIEENMGEVGAIDVEEINVTVVDGPHVEYEIA